MEREDISSIIASYINANGPLDYQKDINVVSSRILAAVVHQEKEEGLITEFSTASLIAELEKRRPKACPDKCAHIGSEFCGYCIWGTFIGEENGAIKDNFKEGK